MRYANIYIYIFVLHRGFFQQPRGRVAPRLGRPPIRQINCSLYMLYLEYPPRILHRDAMKGAVLANKGTTVNAYNVPIGEGLA